MQTKLFLLGLLISLVHAHALTPQEVVILFNSSVPESKVLAETYAEKRNIPTDNLIGLPTKTGRAISRNDYNKEIRDPLIAHFDQKKWWVRGKNPSGQTQAGKNKIRAIVCMNGVPYFIQHNVAAPKPDANGKTPPAKPVSHASVDSELCLLSVDPYPFEAAVPNPYFKSKDPFTASTFPALMLVGRIDGPTWETCHRLIDDAIATEKEGLWGRCYLDLSQKKGGYIMGDQWLQHILQNNQLEGISTVVERNTHCYLTNYPMTDCAMYYGWYAHNVCGPFKDPTYRFKKGAVAVHLHSYSARDLRSPTKHWTGPLLEAGACATVGNVFEPFLGMTHHFSILHDRLLAGHTLLEAGYMSMPVLSWQSVVIGDPLYRPFAAYKNNPTMEKDKAFKAFRMATLQWRKDPEKKTTKLRSAAARMNSSTLYEAIGLEKQQAGDFKSAAAFFNSAQRAAINEQDALRQTLHQIELLRQTKQKQQALALIQKAKEAYKNNPKALVILTSLSNILSPTPPPPAGSKPAKK